MTYKEVFEKLFTDCHCKDMERLLFTVDPFIKMFETGVYPWRTKQDIKKAKKDISFALSLVNCGPMTRLETIPIGPRTEKIYPNDFLELPEDKRKINFDKDGTKLLFAGRWGTILAEIQSISFNVFIAMKDIRIDAIHEQVYWPLPPYWGCRPDDLDVEIIRLLFPDFIKGISRGINTGCNEIDNILYATIYTCLHRWLGATILGNQEWTLRDQSQLYREAAEKLTPLLELIGTGNLILGYRPHENGSLIVLCQ